MARHAAFNYTVDEQPWVGPAVDRHVGARRFAYNRCLEAVKVGLDARQRDSSVDVPWSAFSLINWFNAWKKSEDAGRVFAVDSDGHAELISSGLLWQGEVCAQVFEEAAVDLGRALKAFTDSRQGGPKVGFPRFRKKGRGKESFRLRNRRSSSGRSSIRVGEAGPRSITVPVLGVLQVREDTRRLRRLLRPGPQGQARGRICSVTVSRQEHRILLTVTCELADFHPEMRHPEAPGGPRSFVGVDRGLSALAVVARADRSELERIEAPRHLERALPALRKASRSVSRKVPGSANRHKAEARLRRLHARVARQRKDFTHRTSSRLAKSHGALCLEDLTVKNMVKNRPLARAISDAAWGELGRQLAYKAAWYGGTLVLAPRFFASTKTCSHCGWVADALPLSQRTFVCGTCGLIVDRDLNAAANLAAWGEAGYSSVIQAPDPEARGRVTKACRGDGTGHHRGDGGTGSETPLDGRTQEPALSESSV